MECHHTNGRGEMTLKERTAAETGGCARCGKNAVDCILDIIHQYGAFRTQRWTPDPLARVRLWLKHLADLDIIITRHRAVSVDHVNKEELGEILSKGYKPSEVTDLLSRYKGVLHEIRRTYLQEKFGENGQYLLLPYNQEGGSDDQSQC